MAVNHQGGEKNIFSVLKIVLASLILVLVFVGAFYDVYIIFYGNGEDFPTLFERMKDFGSNFFLAVVDDSPNEVQLSPLEAVSQGSERVQEIKRTNDPIRVGEKVKWKVEVSLSDAGPIAVKIPKNAQDEIVSKVERTGDTANTEFDVVDEVNSEDIVNDEEPVVLNETNITGTEGNETNSSFSADESSEGSFITGNVIRNLNSGKVDAGVVGNFLLGVTGLATIGDDSYEGPVKEVVIDDVDASEYVIEYTTEAPRKEETNILGGKRVKIIGPDGFHYENVIAFTDLDENWDINDESEIQIHWQEEDSFIDGDFQDTDNDGILDYVEWIVPHLSNQTFDIIVITAAEHLDENRALVSDIYESVRELDEVWSEEIPDGHYVRVTFEKNLTSERDITVYPRTISGNPGIEIYEENGNEVIAEFASLNDNQYNKVFLSSLEGEQDTFDLRVSGGSVEFNHIIDPPVTQGQSVSYSRQGVNITFEFNCGGGDCYIGKFADNWSYWVAPINAGDSVNITAMTPAQTGNVNDITLRHGAMADILNMHDHGFSGGTSEALSSARFYAHNASVVVTPPYVVNPQAKGRPTVIIKAISASDSICTQSTRVCIEYYETLTLLEEPPAEDVFRPPFFGTEKPLIPASSFNDSILSSVPVTSGSLTWDQAVDTVLSPNIGQFNPQRSSGQGFHATVNNQINDGYDGYVIQRLNGALMKLAQNATDAAEAAKKRQLALSVAQMGIDLYYIHKNGANPPGEPYPGYGDFSSVGCGAWPGAGGFNQGKITPILFASALLNQNWSENINATLSTLNGVQCFGETGFIQPNWEERGKGVPTFGHLNTQLYNNIGDCQGNNRNCASVGGSSSASYNLYDGLADGDPLSASYPPAYQPIVSGQILGGALATWLTPAVRDNYPTNAKHWLEWEERVKRAGDSVDPDNFGYYNDVNSNSIGQSIMTYLSSGSVNMWTEYKDCFANNSCPGMTSGEAVVTGCDCGSTNQNSPCIGSNISVTVKAGTPGGSGTPVDAVFTWEFNSGGNPTYCGQFANGDYWVAPKNAQTVEITSITSNGSVSADADPVRESMGLLDGSNSYGNYDADENIIPNLPLNYSGINSLLAAVQRNEALEGNCGTAGIVGECVDAYNVVTVLSSVPQNAGSDVIRPNIVGETKDLFTLSDFNFSKIPSEEFLTGTNAAGLEGIRARWSHSTEIFGVTHFTSPTVFSNSYSEGGRAFRSHILIDDYGGGTAATWNSDMMTLFSDDNTLEEKEAALAAMISYGLDLYHSIYSAPEGTNRTWGSGATQHPGKFMPPVFMAALMKNQSYADVLKQVGPSVNNGTHFIGPHELAQIHGGVNVPVWGDLRFGGIGHLEEEAYWNALVDAQCYDNASGNCNPNLGSKAARDPYGYIDGPASKPGTSYISSSAGGQRAMVATMFLFPEVCEIVNYDRLVEYVDRLENYGIRTAGDECVTPDAREDLGSCEPYPNGEGCVYYEVTWGPDTSNPGSCITTAISPHTKQGRFLEVDGTSIGYAYISHQVENNWETIRGNADNCRELSGGNDTSPPSIVLSSPNNGVTIKYAGVNLTASVTDSVQLKNATLHLWNSSSDLINTTSQILSGTSANVGVNVTLPYAGNFSWNYFASDNSSNAAFASSNFSLFYNDSVPTNPEVILLSPPNGATTEQNQTYFAASFTDESQLANATLHIWNSTHGLINTTVNVLSGTSDSSNISVNLPYKNVFRWNYLVYDNSSNAAFASSNFTLNFLSIDSNPPELSFTDPTPTGVGNYSSDSIYVNLSTTDDSDHYSFVDFDKSLIGWWGFDSRTSGGGVTDLSTYSNNGTLSGDTFTNSSGQFGNASWFDADGDYISFADTNRFTFADLSGDLPFSMSTWIYYQGSGGPGGSASIIAKYDDFSPWNGEWSWVITPSSFLGSGSDKLYFQLLDDGPTNRARIETTSSIPKNEWVHAVITYNGNGQDTGLSFYINGSLTEVIRNTQGSYTTMTNTNSLVRVGITLIDGGSSLSYLNGSIDEVLIFNRTLSAGEVSALYNASAKQYENNFTGLANGTHAITGHAVDSSGNRASVQRTIVLGAEDEEDSTPPSITLSSPSDESVISYENVNITAILADNVQLENATLHLWNSTNDLINITSRDLSGTSVSVGVNVTLPYEGDFEWNYFASDNSSNSGFASSNFSFSYTEVEELASCNLTSATWSTTQAVEGDTVNLIVNGTSCNGGVLVLEIFEDDILGTDPVNTNPDNVVVAQNTSSGTWTAEWAPDFFTDPEYFFNASLASNASISIVSSRLKAEELTVTELNPECGNGIIQTGEQCDDGGTVPGDGCSAICQVENNWICTGAPSVCELELFDFNLTIKDKSGIPIEGATLILKEFDFANYGSSAPSLNKSHINVSDDDGVVFLYDMNLAQDKFFELEVIANSTGTVTHVGPQLHPFPSEVLSQGLAGSDLLVDPAVGLNISIYRGDNRNSYMGFGYDVIDAEFGNHLTFSHENEKVDNVMYLPLDGAYIVNVHPNESAPIDVTYGPGECLDSTGASAGDIIDCAVNGTVLFRSVYGNLSQTGSYFEGLNYLVSGGRVFSDAAFQDIRPGSGDVTDVYNAATGFFNVTVPATDLGAESLMLFFINQNGARYMAMYNLTMDLTSSDVNAGIVQVAPVYGSQGTFRVRNFMNQETQITTNVTKFNITQEESVAAGPSGFFTEMEITYPNGKEVVWSFAPRQGTSMIDVPIMENSNAVLQVFASGASPKRVTLNSQQLEETSRFDIVLRNFERRASSGSVHMGGVRAELFDFADEDCRVPNPDQSCLLLDFTNTSSSNAARGAFRMMLLTEASVRMKDPNSNVAVMYIGTNLRHSGVPPADFNDQAVSSSTSGGELREIWRFGSSGPKIYEYAYVTIPYDDEVINEAEDVVISITELYDTTSGDNWTLEWNSSSPVAEVQNLESYSARFDEWEYLLNGTTCLADLNSISVSQPCGINTTEDNIYLRVPHFSGVSFDLFQDQQEDPPGSPGPSSGGGGGGGGGGAFVPDTTTTTTPEAPVVDTTPESESGGRPVEETVEEETPETEEREPIFYLIVGFISLGIIVVIVLIVVAVRYSRRKF